MVKVFVAAMAAVLSVVSVGCRSQQSQQAGWPDELNDFTIVWTAANDVDLVTGPAVPVRAYIESFVLQRITGDDKYLYPGFTDAVEERWRPAGGGTGEPWVGTLTNHIVSLEESDGEVRAIGCMFTYTAATPAKDSDEYEGLGVMAIPEAEGITPFEVRLSVPEHSALPAGPQQGPERAPFDNVFGGYRVTGYYGGYFEAPGQTPLWENYDQATRECIAAAPDSRERRTYVLENYLPKSDFFTRPPAPGWPAKPAS